MNTIVYFGMSVALGLIGGLTMSAGRPAIALSFLLPHSGNVQMEVKYAVGRPVDAVSVVAAVNGYAVGLFAGVVMPNSAVALPSSMAVASCSVMRGLVM